MHGSVLNSVSDSPSPEEFNANVDRMSLLSATMLFKCRFCLVHCWYPVLLDHFHTCDPKWTLSNFTFIAIASTIAKLLYTLLQPDQIQADWALKMAIWLRTNKQRTGGGTHPLQVSSKVVMPLT